MSIRIPVVAGQASGLKHVLAHVQAYIAARLEAQRYMQALRPLVLGLMSDGRYSDGRGESGRTVANPKIRYGDPL